jgi:hypothetical protein
MTVNPNSEQEMGMTPKRIYASKRKAGNNIVMRKNCKMEILKTCIIQR